MTSETDMKTIREALEDCGYFLQAHATRNMMPSYTGETSSAKYDASSDGSVELVEACRDALDALSRLEAPTDEQRRKALKWLDSYSHIFRNHYLDGVAGDTFITTIRAALQETPRERMMRLHPPVVIKDPAAAQSSGVAEFLQGATVERVTINHVVDAPDGWQLVPKVPTLKMQTACHSVALPCPDIYGDFSENDRESAGYDFYMAMLAAAPTPNAERE